MCADSTLVQSGAARHAKACARARRCKHMRAHNRPGAIVRAHASASMRASADFGQVDSRVAALGCRARTLIDSQSRWLAVCLSRWPAGWLAGIGVVLVAKFAEFANIVGLCAFCARLPVKTRALSMNDCLFFLSRLSDCLSVCGCSDRYDGSGATIMMSQLVANARECIDEWRDDRIFMQRARPPVRSNRVQRARRQSIDCLLRVRRSCAC